MARRLALLLVVPVLGACSLSRAGHARKVETALETAGFHRIPADTPEKREHLERMTAFTLRRSMRDGKPHYWWADPAACRCLYVGSETAYRRYEDRHLQREISDSERAATRADENTAAVDKATDSSLDSLLGPAGILVYPLP